MNLRFAILSVAVFADDLQDDEEGLLQIRNFAAHDASEMMLDDGEASFADAEEASRMMHGATETFEMLVDAVNGMEESLGCGEPEYFSKGFVGNGISDGGWGHFGTAPGNWIPREECFKRCRDYAGGKCKAVDVDEVHGPNGNATVRCNLRACDPATDRTCEVKAPTSNWHIYSVPPKKCAEAHLAPPGAIACDSGNPVSEQQCLAAVQQLVKTANAKQGRNTLVKGYGGKCNDGSWGSVPTGCSAQSGQKGDPGVFRAGDWAAHFKTGPATPPNCASKVYQLVCTGGAVPPKPPNCTRSTGWCAVENSKYYYEKDCDGDGILDRICDTHARDGLPEWSRGPYRWIMLSSDCRTHNNGDAPSCDSLKR